MTARAGRQRWNVAAARVVEALEPRRLLSVTVADPIDPVVVRLNAPNQSVPLAGVFATTNLNGVTGPVVRFPVEWGSGAQKVTGSINIELFNSTPLTKQNFLNYINSGRYHNVFVHRSVPGFVIQAGGFLSPNGAAVQTDPPILNEFNLSPKDAQGRVNVRGTVAMAKVGGNPNSATSQWFINLGDNSGNLDNQNGGFTVFGRVFSGGMALADQIAALPRYNFGGAFTELPLAGYTVDTDVEPENLVTFKNPAVVNNPQTFFTYVASSSDTQVVEVSVGSDNNLNLNFGNKVGSSTVSVTATDLTGASVTTNFTVTVANPSLQVQVAGQTVQPGGAGAVNLGTVFTGQVATRTLSLRNTGTGPISLGLPVVPAGLAVSGSVPASLSPGQQVTLTLEIDTSSPRVIEGVVEIPTDAVNATDGAFRFNVVGEVGSEVALGSGGARSVVFVDGDGTRATFSLRGPGSGRLHFTGDGLTATTVRGVTTVTGSNVVLTDIALSGTTAGSTLSLTTRGGNQAIDVGELTAESPVRGLALRGLRLTSSLSLPGVTGSVQLGGLSGVTASVTGPGVIGSLQLGDVTGGTLTVNGTVRSMSLGAVSGVTLTVNGAVGTLTAVSLTGASLTFGGTLGTLTARQGITDSVLAAASSVQRVTTSVFVGSSLRAGLLPGVVTPSRGQDFVPASAVRQFTVTSRSADAFSGSSLTAANLGRVALGQLTGGGNASSITTVGMLQLTGRNEAGRAFSLRRVTLGDAAQEALAAAGVAETRLQLNLLPLAVA
ncbi:MAG: peptidylprolyl isomerase [Tepidisphaerales bacterium]